MSERFENTRAVLEAIRQDFQEHREQHGLPKALAAAAASASILPYQLGGLESTLAYTGTQTLHNTHNPFLAGGAMGLASFGIEVGLTLATTATLRRLPQTASTIEAIKYEGKSPKPPAEGRLARLRNVGSAVGFTVIMGSPGMVLRSFVRSPEQPVRVHRVKGIRAAGALAVTNSAIGTVLTGGLEILPASTTQDVINQFNQPWTYGVVFALVGGSRFVSYLTHELRSPKD